MILEKRLVGTRGKALIGFMFLKIFVQVDKNVENLIRLCYLHHADVIRF